MNGGEDGPNGSPLARRDRIALATVVAATLTVACVNALTVADDFAEAGRPLDPWEPWVWELTSAAFWILVTIPLLRALRRLRPPGIGWPSAVVATVLLSLPLSALHVGFLAASRAAIYAGLGSHYAFDWSWSQLVYEWRKDLLSVLILAVIGYLVDRLGSPAVAAPPGPATTPPFRLEVRDGARIRWFSPGEIERVEAAGNYVELFTTTGPVLHRATLTTVAAQLAPHDFVRIHRSRLVRRDAVASVSTMSSGDFEAILASGTRVGGSRRFRKQLA